MFIYLHENEKIVVYCVLVCKVLKYVRCEGVEERGFIYSDCFFDTSSAYRQMMFVANIIHTVPTTLTEL